MTATVARWHAHDGHHTGILLTEPKRLRFVIPGYPVQLRTLPLTERRYITELPDPVRRAARRLRVMARNNSSAPVRRVLDKLIGGA